MQSQLVEAEKMASLGQLVSGVAHEINTPIGIAVTSSSYLKDQSNTFFKRFKNGSITKSDFENFMIDMDSGSDLLTSNLNKASALIKNFKQVAVDQTIDEIRGFQLKQYILEVLTSLNHKIKNTNFKLDIICENEVHVRTYAGSISAIITHLFNNSLIHGFEHMTEGTITIKIEDLGDTAKITYCDTGCGIPSIDIEKITSPFYTTKRGGDCSGLGMYIVYNQATQRLCGNLSYHSLNVLPINAPNQKLSDDSPHGLEIEITFPKYL
jgi:signal transduction histidine kinase